jgi:hypothetical protein
MAILAIDEINRADPAVQQELMQVVLDRKINNFILPENCSIISAGNPDGFDYQVNDMNDAFIDRLNVYTMESDLKVWMKWALSKGAISQTVLEFLSERPEYFHDPKSVERVKPTPRSWEKFSRALNFINDEFGSDEDKIYEEAKGLVGTTIANSFITFIRNKENPLPKVEDIFESKEDIFKNVVEEFKNLEMMRKQLVIDRCTVYLSKKINEVKKAKSELSNRFVKILEKGEKDSVFGELKHIAKNYPELHSALANNEAYMDIFFENNKRIRG